MAEKSIKIQRTESVLRELISEAIGQLSDERLNGLVVTEVLCSRGKSDATVYIEGSDIDAATRVELLKALRKSSGFIAKYCLACEDWFKMPKLTFSFDDRLTEMTKMQKIFDAINNRPLS